MQSSSSTRRKTAFVPWLAALVIGATAHAGWLIHELREHEPPRVVTERVVTERVVTQIVAEPSGEPEPEHVSRSRLQRRMRVWARHHSSSQRVPSRTPHCRHASLELAPSEDGSELDLDMWIAQTDRYTYTIDRRVLDRVALADFDGDAIERLGVVARALGLAEPIELRNIQAGTPLFVLGLRTGDRLHAISTHGGEALERVEVAIERRGRPIELVYRLI